MNSIDDLTIGQGWYTAIEDLILNLPNTEFAPWQLKCMPNELRETVLMSQATSGNHRGSEYSMGTQHADEPAYTITANSNMNVMRAFLVTNSSIWTQRDKDEPMFAVTASQVKGMPRAVIADRVVMMTTRCLARFQSFPDSYWLPDSKGLASRIIGNAVPPLQYEKILRDLI